MRQLTPSQTLGVTITPVGGQGVADKFRTLGENPTLENHSVFAHLKIKMRIRPRFGSSRFDQPYAEDNGEQLCRKPRSRWLE